MSGLILQKTGERRSGKRQYRSLHYMRGLAALLVLYAHLFVSATTDHVLPKLYLPMLTTFPAVNIPPHLQALVLQPEIIMERFNIISGDLGVMLFFLISGFLIPRSIESVGIRHFMVRRFFRIFPLNIAVIGLIATFMHYYAHLYGVTSPYTIMSTLLSAALVAGWAGYFYTTPLIWTLTVEISFYVMMMAWIGWKKQIGLLDLLQMGLLCAALACLGPTLHQAYVPVLYFCHHGGYDSMYMIYMLIGTALAKADRSRILAGLTIAALAALFLFSETIFDREVFKMLPVDRESAATALALFIGAISAERFVPRSRVLEFFADISFPLYLMHIPFAWMMIFELRRHDVPMRVTFAATCCACIGLAWLLHVLIERPSHNYGIRLTARKTDAAPSKSVAAV